MHKFDLPWRQISTQGEGDPHGEDPAQAGVSNHEARGHPSRRAHRTAQVRCRESALLRMMFRSWRAISRWVEPFAKPIERRLQHDGYRFRLRSSSYGGHVAPPILQATAAGYLAALVVNQICGVPLTPAFSIVVFRSGDDAKAFALSAVLKSCVTVTSLALSTD